jgi:predicted dehydrogenase
MVSQVKIGVVGTSWWSDMIFFPILQNYDRADLIAVCGRNQERANEVAEKYAIADVYSDYRKMFSNVNLDAVIIATPDDTHYEMAMAAFDAGLHVLCEKPVALNSAHAKEMLDKAEEVGVKHMVMYTHHWMPYLQHAKQLIDEDYLGRVRHGSIHWLAQYGQNSAYNWRFDGNRSNGIVSDLGSHLIHWAQWSLGKIVAVTGQLDIYVEREGLDGAVANPAHDTALFLAEFESGARINFYISATAHVFDEDMKLSVNLHGEQGMLDAGWNYGEHEKSWIIAQQLGTEDKIQESHPMDIVDHFDKNSVGARLFVDCILDDIPIKPSLNEGYQVQKIIDAVIQSHETGRRVIIEA